MGALFLATRGPTVKKRREENHAVERGLVRICAVMFKNHGQTHQALMIGRKIDNHSYQMQICGEMPVPIDMRTFLSTTSVKK